MKKLVLLAGLAGVAGCTSHDKNNASAQDASSKSYQFVNNPMSDASSQQFSQEAAHPKFTAETRFAAGQLAESEGRLDTAAGQYQQALQIDPKHVPSLYRLAVVYTKQRNFDQAIPILKRYVEATGDAASSYSNLGFCYELAGDTKNAAASYQAGIARDPTNPACRTNYGLLLAKQNRIDEAKAQLSTVLKADEVAYDLGMVFQQQGKLPEARVELKRALAINPQNANAKAQLASLPHD